MFKKILAVSLLVSTLAVAGVTRVIEGDAVRNGSGYLYIPSTTPSSGRAAMFGADGKIGASSVTTAELFSLTGITPGVSVQAQLDSKQSTLTLGNLTSPTTGVSVGGGTGAVVGSGATVSIQNATAAQPGLLTAADFTTFNAKQNALTFGDLTSPTTGVSVGNGVGSVIGSGTTVSIQNATAAQPGLLTAADFNTFNNKQPAGNYLDALSGEASSSGNGSSVVTLSNNAVISKVLTGFVKSPMGAIAAGDSVLTAFNKAAGGMIVSDANQNAVGGSAAGASMTTAIRSTMFGVSAGEQVTGGNEATFIGWQAGRSVIATMNTAVGSRAMYHATTGSFNTAIGQETLRENTVGTENTAMGYEALTANQTGNANTALGVQAMANNLSGDQNTAVGKWALFTNKGGSFNTASGYESLLFNTTGSLNAGYGYFSLIENTTGTNNACVGANCLRFNTDGSQNIAMGFQAGRGVNTSNQFNNGVFLGYRTGFALLQNANGNTFVGHQSGDTVTTGQNNTLIGKDSDASPVTANAAVAVGYLALAADNGIAIGASAVAAANTAVLGSTNITTTTLRGTVNAGTEARIAGSSSGYVGLNAGSAPTSYSITLPSAAPSNGQVLTATSPTVTAWQTPSAGSGSNPMCSQVLGSAAQVTAGTATCSAFSSCQTLMSDGDQLCVLVGPWTANWTVSKSIAITGSGRGSILTGSVTFASGSTGAMIEKMKLTDNLTVNSGVSNVIADKIWFAAGKTFIDNGTASLLSGSQE